MGGMAVCAGRGQKSEIVLSASNWCEMLGDTYATDSISNAGCHTQSVA